MVLPLCLGGSTSGCTAATADISVAFIKRMTSLSGPISRLSRAVDLLLLSGKGSSILSALCSLELLMANTDSSRSLSSPPRFSRSLALNSTDMTFSAAVELNDVTAHRPPKGGSLGKCNTLTAGTWFVMKSWREIKKTLSLRGVSVLSDWFSSIQSIIKLYTKQHSGTLLN